MDYKDLAIDISKWIKAYADKNNTKCLVVGISGGVDSAVVSTLAASTGISTYVLSMPIKQKSTQLDLAEGHIEWLVKNYNNVKPLHFDLTSIFENFIKDINVQLDNAFSSKHAEANTRSRLRMLSLYQIASVKSGIVVGTGNKVEDYGIGFYTKYGDGGVDISPIGDLYKTEVWELARSLNIQKEIIHASPTDGLWDDGRTDEDQIGMSYQQLEWVMKKGLNMYREELMTLSKKEIEIVENYLNLNLQNSHKMNPIPIYKKPKKNRPLEDK